MVGVQYNYRPQQVNPKNPQISGSYERVSMIFFIFCCQDESLGFKKQLSPKLGQQAML